MDDLDLPSPVQAHAPSGRALGSDRLAAALGGRGNANPVPLQMAPPPQTRRPTAAQQAAANQQRQQQQQQQAQQAQGQPNGPRPRVRAVNASNANLQAPNTAQQNMQQIPAPVSMDPRMVQMLGSLRQAGAAQADQANNQQMLASLNQPASNLGALSSLLGPNQIGVGGQQSAPGTPQQQPNAQQIMQQQRQLATLYSAGQLSAILKNRVESNQMTKPQAEQMLDMARKLAQSGLGALPNNAATAGNVNVRPSATPLASALAGQQLNTMSAAQQIQLLRAQQQQQQQVAVGTPTGSGSSLPSSLTGQLTPQVPPVVRADLLRGIDPNARNRPTFQNLPAVRPGVNPLQSIAVAQQQTQAAMAAIASSQPREPAAPQYAANTISRNIFGSLPLHGLLVQRPQPTSVSRSGTIGGGSLGTLGPGLGDIVAPPMLQPAEPTGEGQRLRELVARIGPGERVDPEAEDVLYALADAFLSSLARNALLLAQHRGSTILEERDVAVVLEQWGIDVPGYGQKKVDVDERADGGGPIRKGGGPRKR